MEEKYYQIHALLSVGSYPKYYDKSQRQNLRRYASKFTLRDGELFFKNTRRVIKTKEETRRLFAEFHSSPKGGHSGMHKTRSAISSRFYWFGMVQDIDKWIQECDQCQRISKRLTVSEPLPCIKVSAAWELVAIDLTGPLPKTSSGYQYILTATDYFSKWVEAYPLVTKSAAEVSEKLCRIINQHGCPTTILSDQGREFVNKLNTKLCDVLHGERSVTVVFHLQTSALDKETNDNIKRALRELVNERQNKWDIFLDATLFSLRSEVHTTTEHTPFKLMNGREARFPSELPAELPMEEGSADADSVTLDLLLEARETVRGSPLGVINTPMIPWCQTTLPCGVSCNIQIKLENMQRTGSFKIRGVANQFARRPAGGHFVTMSAGNYGKSFAYASKHYGSQGKVVMPETAPVSRSILIQSFGVEVERVPTTRLMDVVNRCVQEDGMTFLHSYDDLDLIAGHASLGLEVLEVMPYPDVVVVCCGGGGLLAGVAAAIKLSGCENTRIYGVEPEGACTMYRSFQEKKPVGMDAKSVASGLAPPFAGAQPFALCQRYVDEIVLINDEEIKAAVSTLYGSGLVVEPSGSAAFAAIVGGKIPKLEGKDVVCILSGGNVGKDELANFPD